MRITVTEGCEQPAVWTAAVTLHESSLNTEPDKSRQALMRFMLEEYDALPFGLLRQEKSESQCGRAEESPKFVHCCPDPGQKVMPLDKVGTYPNKTRMARA